VLDKATPDMQWHSALAVVVGRVVLIRLARGGGSGVWPFLVKFILTLVGTVGVVPWVEEGSVGGSKSLAVGSEGGLTWRRVFLLSIYFCPIVVGVLLVFLSLACVFGKEGAQGVVVKCGRGGGRGVFALEADGANGGGVK
jgi:hypothetical protein